MQAEAGLEAGGELPVVDVACAVLVHQRQQLRSIVSQATLHRKQIKQHEIRNTREFAYKAVNNTEYVQFVLIIYHRQQLQAGNIACEAANNTEVVNKALTDKETLHIFRIL